MNYFQKELIGQLREQGHKPSIWFALQYKPKYEKNDMKEAQQKK